MTGLGSGIVQGNPLTWGPVCTPFHGPSPGRIRVLKIGQDDWNTRAVPQMTCKQAWTMILRLMLLNVRVSRRRKTFGGQILLNSEDKTPD